MLRSIFGKNRTSGVESTGDSHSIINFIRIVLPHIPQGFVQAWRAEISRPGLPLTILFGLSSLTLAWWRDPLPSLALGFVVSAIIFVSVLGGGLAALIGLAPEVVAEIKLSGRKVRDVLTTLSLAVYIACWRVHRTAYPLESILDRLSDGLSERFEPEMCCLVVRNSWMRDGAEARKIHERLRKLYDRQQIQLKRIEALKIRAAAELGLDTNRLCGPILRYSPALHSDRVKELIEKLETIDFICRHERFVEPQELDRLRGLVSDANGIIVEAKKRISYQEDILRFAALSDDVIATATARSASASVTKYAASLAYVAKENLLKSPRRWTSAVSKLNFLYQKQSAYPGINPHLSLVRLFRNLQRINRSDYGDHAPSYCPKIVDQQLRVLAALAAGTYEDCFGKSAVGVADWPESARRQLESLELLPIYVGNYMHHARWVISKRFSEFYAVWLDKPAGHHFLVTQGNSSTVRDTLKGALKQDRQIKALPHVVCFPSAQDPHLLEPRRTIHALKNSVGRDIADWMGIYDVDNFLHLISPGDRVLMLLGAEAFDNRRRFVHPRGLSGFLEELRRGCREKGVDYLIAIVAETYKLQESELIELLRLRGDRFDQRVEIYGPEDDHVDIVLCNEGSYPENWDSMIEARLAKHGESLYGESPRDSALVH